MNTIEAGRRKRCSGVGRSVGKVPSGGAPPTQVKVMRAWAEAGSVDLEKRETHGDI